MIPPLFKRIIIIKPIVSYPDKCQNLPVYDDQHHYPFTDRVPVTHCSTPPQQPSSYYPGPPIRTHAEEDPLRIPVHSVIPCTDPHTFRGLHLAARLDIQYLVYSSLLLDNPLSLP